MEWIVHQLEEARPRIISPRRFDPPVLVFLDGSCEDEGTMIGGVLFAPGERVQCFGARVPDKLVESWKTRLLQKQVIGQAELFPAVVARWTWAHHLKGKRVLYFIDNESARLALVKAYSPVVPSLKLIMACLGWDQTNLSSAWYARVPTHSNIADGPSRFAIPEELKAYNPLVVTPVIDPDFSKDSGLSMGDWRTL